jgi:hypothetical protein
MCSLSMPAQARADPATRTGRPDQLGQGLPLHLTDRRRPVLGSVEPGLDDVGSQRQPGPPLLSMWPAQPQTAGP